MRTGEFRRMFLKKQYLRSRLTWLLHERGREKGATAPTGWLFADLRKVNRQKVRL